MTTSDLIELLDQKFGNPLGPRQYAVVREAIEVLRELDTRAKDYEELIAVNELNKQ